MKQTVLAAAVATALSVGGMATAQAALVQADVMTVTSGQFGLGLLTGNGFFPISHFGTGAADIAGQFNLPGWNVNVGQNTGTGTVPPVPAAPGSIGSFQFGGAQLNTFTASTSTQAAVGGGPFAAPSGLFQDTGGTSSFNMSAFYANWNGTDFNQGNSAATLTTSGCVAGTCNFTMTWQSLIVGTPFDGNTGSWSLSGTVKAVPIPAAVWLLGSGLIGLVGVSRRRKILAVA